MNPLVEEWLRYLVKVRNLAHRTAEEYERDVRQLATSLPGVPLELFTTEQIRDFILGLDVKSSSVARRMAGITSFFRYLVKTGRRGDDPTVRLDRPRVKKPLPRPVRDFAARAANLEPTLRACAVFLYETGLRIDEFIRVELPTPAPDEMIVLGKGSKERTVPLSDEARAAIDELGGRSPLSKRQIQDGLRAQADMTPHQLRHTFAQDCADSGVELSVLQDLMGHASPATTKGYYENSVARLRRDGIAVRTRGRDVSLA